MAKSKQPKPAPPAPTREQLTPTEFWYLTCLRILSDHLKRPPSLPELAQYCGRTLTPTYLALLSCERKGHAKRNRRSRKWHLVDGAA